VISFHLLTFFSLCFIQSTYIPFFHFLLLILIFLTFFWVHNICWIFMSFYAYRTLLSRLLNLSLSDWNILLCIYLFFITNWKFSIKFEIYIIIKF
jgi:hypothetical protein